MPKTTLQGGEGEACLLETLASSPKQAAPTPRNSHTKFDTAKYKEHQMMQSNCRDTCWGSDAQEIVPSTGYTEDCQQRTLSELKDAAEGKTLASETHCALCLQSTVLSSDPDIPVGAPNT